MVRVRTDRKNEADGWSLLLPATSTSSSLRKCSTTRRRRRTRRAPGSTLTLAATLLEPITVDRLGGTRTTRQSRFGSTFRFRSGSPVRTDFGLGDQRAEVLARLALAGRATVVVPGGLRGSGGHGSQTGDLRGNRRSAPLDLSARGSPRIATT